jgi:hypothetical protein
VMSPNCLSDTSYVLSYLCSGTVAVIYHLECKTSVDFHSFYFHSILGEFAKLRKSTISFVMSVRPSFRPSEWNNGTDFYKILYLSIFLNCVDKLKISLKSDMNNGYFE